MKKFIVSLLLVFSIPAFAQHYHGHGHWRHGGDGRWFWMVPAVVGGIVVYEATRPPVQQPPVVVQPPVIVQQNQVINDSKCSPWTQIQNPDGTITTTRTCSQ